jgi:thiamine-phosphate pyrophosphorylase
MELIVFTAPKNFTGEAELLNLFLKDRFLTLHIRKPHFSEVDMRVFLSNIEFKYHAQLIIHDFIHLLSEFKLKGFHCTRRFLSTSDKSILELKEKYPTKSFSKSCHSLEELTPNSGFNYVFLSPVFDSISKKDYQSKFDLKEVTETLKSNTSKVVALGGVSTSNIQQLKKCRFIGVGVLGSIWNSLEPKREYEKIKKAIL